MLNTRNAVGDWVLSTIINHRQFVQTTNNESDENFEKRMSGYLASAYTKSLYAQAITEFNERNDLIKEYENRLLIKQSQTNNLIFPLDKGHKDLMFLEMIKVFHKQTIILNEIKAKVLLKFKNN